MLTKWKKTGIMIIGGSVWLFDERRSARKGVAMVRDSEKKWAKENGLRKTGLRTREYGMDRVVYRARDGRLFYVFDCSYKGTFPEYCFDPGKGEYRSAHDMAEDAKRESLFRD